MSQKSNRTVFVVGAGASHEFGLPVGSQLQDQISHQTMLKVERGSIQAFSHNANFLDLLPAAAGLQSYTASDKLRLAEKSVDISAGVRLAASIDNYLHAQQSDAELVAIGKLAIAKCILEAEQASTLAYKTNGFGFAGARSQGATKEPHNSWLGVLIKVLSAGRDFNAFCKAVSTITFVCFNYDRCIERYFSCATALIYPKLHFDIHTLENSLHIVHPYGSLGDLLPQQGVNGTFGRSRDPDFILSAAKGIRTFTEGMESDVRKRIGDAFSEAQNAIFLGYGFISVNDDFLFGGGPFQMLSVLGTTYGILDERKDAIDKRLSDSCMKMLTPYHGWQPSARSPLLRSEGCADLLNRFSHKLEDIGR